MPESWEDQFRVDDELTPGAGGPLEPDRARWRLGMWVAVALLVFGGGLAMYFLWGPSEPSAPTTAEVPADVPELAAEPPEPLGPEVEPLVLPPLAETDLLVRTLVSELSEHPRLAAWLATGGLIRNFTVVVSNVAEGRTPAINLRALRPSGSFLVRERGEDLVIDPKSYERYTPLANALVSINPEAAARVYASLKPRIEEAYAELGFPNTTFDATLERAIVHLLRTPIPTAPVRVEPQGGTGYGYVDSRFETLTPAQRHLLRMGPQNARVVQTALREMALALGISPQRLPPAGTQAR